MCLLLCVMWDGVTQSLGNDNLQVGSSSDRVKLADNKMIPRECPSVTWSNTSLWENTVVAKI